VRRVADFLFEAACEIIRRQRRPFRKFFERKRLLQIVGNVGKQFFPNGVFLSFRRRFVEEEFR